jgi:murein DD-endopeptidase MepM/ murein hydrolase activator NlpD
MARTSENERPKRRRDVWLYLVLALALIQAALRLIPELRPGLFGVVCWDFGSELVPVAAGALLVVALIVSLLRRPFWGRWRVGGFLALVGLVFSGATFRTYPSSHDGRPSRVAFRLPLDGPITVVWGGPTEDVNYHVVAAEQRWAYDLLVTEQGRTHKGEGSRLEEYYAYGLPVLAPADGKVVETFNGDPDMKVGELGGGTTAAGNHIVIEVAPREFLWLCHLQPGSITVGSGDHVAEGQTVGKVGNSGNTSEPHLHVHLQDTNDLNLGEGIPLEFHHYTINGRYVERGIPTGTAGESVSVGQIVENAPARPPRPSQATPVSTTP